MRFPLLLIVYLIIGICELQSVYAQYPVPLSTWEMVNPHNPDENMFNPDSVMVDPNDNTIYTKGWFSITFFDDPFGYPILTTDTMLIADLNVLDTLLNPDLSLENILDFIWELHIVCGAP